MTNPLVADVAGDGPPVVLLHGQPGVSGNWWRVVPLLSPHWTVVTPDRPGYGRTGGRATDFSGNAWAVVDLLDRLDLPDAVVVGHSWAGAVALSMAIEAPERVRGVVLVASVAPGIGVGRLDRLLAVPLVGEAAGIGTIEVTRRLLLTRHIERAVRAVLPDDTLEALIHANPGPGSWRAFADEQRSFVWAMPPLQEALRRIDAPVVVLSGDADRVVGPGAAQSLADAIPGATLRLVEGGGHMLPWEHPAAIADAVGVLRPGDRPV